MNNYGFEATIQVHDKITFEEALEYLKCKLEDKPIPDGNILNPDHENCESIYSLSVR